MRKNNNKSSVPTGLVGLLGVAIGAGLGFLASKLLQPQSKQQKEQPKQQVPAIPAKPQTSHLSKTDIGSYDDLEELMICPVTHEIMTDPHILTTCGHTFEKKVIVDWILNKGTCPLCVTKASASDIQSNYQLKELIHHYQKKKNDTKKEGEKQMKK